MGSLSNLLTKAGVSRSAVNRIVSTGVGGKKLGLADIYISEVSAAVMGTQYYYPDAKLMLHMGAEKIIVIRSREAADILKFNMNDKCASGSGMFLENMAEVLEIPVEDLGVISKTSSETVSISTQCAVFAESEVVGLIHKGIPKATIARGLHDSIALTVKGILNRIGGATDDLYFSGGVARNEGMSESLKHQLGVDVIIPPDPQYMCALGAALSR